MHLAISRRVDHNDARHAIALKQWNCIETLETVTEDRNGLSIADNKRTDGLTLLPFQEAKPLAWAVTVIRILAQSYVLIYTTPSGAAVELTVTRKSEKNVNLPTELFDQLLLRIQAQLPSQPYLSYSSYKRTEPNRTELSVV